MPTNPSLLPEWDTSPYLENNNSHFRTFFEKFKIYKNVRVNEKKAPVGPADWR